MAGTVQESAQEVPQGDYPPHILNHIALLEEQKRAARGESNSSGASPPGPSDGSHRSSTSPFFDFLRINTSRNKEGEKPKRRGPKPDSKPALTRKQELNRQAQRTHRERKEKYVRSLEEDVIRLREAFTVITKEKTQILQENRRLKEILELHGIPYTPGVPSGNLLQGPNQMSGAPQPISAPARSYDEIGVEFVLALERPCMEHINLLANNTVNHHGEFHGHALMLSCPPESYTMQNPELWDPPKHLELQAADLSVLFHLSNRLQLEGEMTPIAVWATIARHERFSELSTANFEAVKQELLPKIKCHGFGAVIEEFEVRDALSRLFQDKPGTFI